MPILAQALISGALNTLSFLIHVTFFEVFLNHIFMYKI